MSVHATGNSYNQNRHASAVVAHTYVCNFSDAGIASAILIDTFKASANAPVELEVSVNLTTAFNAATTNVLTVGTSTTATEIFGANAIAEGTVGYYPATNGPDQNYVMFFTGKSSAGAISTGTAFAKVGDAVLDVVNLTTPGADASGSFESVISVAAQIQQTSGTDLSGSKFLAIAQNATSSTSSESVRLRITADTGIYVKYTQTGTAATAGVAQIIVKEYQVNTRPITQT